VATIPAGYLAVDIPVQPIASTANRGNKTVVLAANTNAAYQVSGHGKAIVTIIDDTYNIPPPSVSLTSPTNNSVFGYPAVITLQAEATDAQAAISSVSFYVDDYLLGRATNNPYTLVWTNAHPGRYTLFARAVDEAGQSTLSSAINLSVTNQVPTVTLTSPTNGENFTAHSNIGIQAQASEDTTSVTFFANLRRLGVATNAPYAVIWSNAPAGVFLLRATAANGSGARGNSNPVLINVSRQ
jgi:hypothetical protein